MAGQTHQAALHPLATVKLNGASVASSSLRALVKTALQAAPHSLTALAAEAIVVRVKHFDMLVVTGPVTMSDAGNAASADTMSYAANAKREVRNCKELFGLAKIFAVGAYDVRLELYS